MKRTLWSNTYETIEGIEKDVLENPEDFPNADEHNAWSIACEINDDYLDDERMNLDKELGTNLVMIGRLGLWNGTRTGWKHIHGTNLNDIFNGTVGDYVTWYVEDDEIKCEDIHHDGTNYYTYRAIKSDLSEWEFDELMAEGKNIDELTEKLGHYVAEIYGF